MDLLALERITADQFPEAIGLMCRGAFVRAHLVEYNMRAGFGSLKRGLASGKARAYNLNYLQSLFDHKREIRRAFKKDVVPKKPIMDPRNIPPIMAAAFSECAPA